MNEVKKIIVWLNKNKSADFDITEELAGVHSFPTRRSSDLGRASCRERVYKELSEAAKKNKEIEIDLVDQKIHKGDNRPFDFEIESFRKECLLNGYDDIALTLKKDAKINTFEQNKRNLTPWLY